MQAVNYGMKGMAANVKLAEAMGETTKTMGQMNKVMDPMKIAKTMSDFEQANAKMSMTEETSTYFLHLMTPLRAVMIYIFLCTFCMRFPFTFNFTVNDALDDIMADSDDESEEQAVIDKVLDEIGIEISGKVTLNSNDLKSSRYRVKSSHPITKTNILFQLADAPSAHAGTIGVKSKAIQKPSEEDQKIEALLAELKG